MTFCLNNFSVLSHIMCFNDKGNNDPGIKKVYTFTNFRLQRAHLLCFKEKFLIFSGGCQNSGEDCNLMAGFREVEDPIISDIIGHYYCDNL